jgi:starch phosphorylase
MPNYRVTQAEKMIPAAELSEQISTAGKEASGTGNMKFAANGALTIGTLDGANVEIREEVGAENIFIFGRTVEEVADIRRNGYNPYDRYFENEDLRAVVDWLGTDFFTPREGPVLRPVRDSLLGGGDPFLVLEDFADYLRVHKDADRAYRDRDHWTRMAVLNTARVGQFSSDRTIRQYAGEIWKLERVPVNGEASG